MAKVLVIHGPNLNLLGKRETDIYGDDTIEIINSGIKKPCDQLGSTNHLPTTPIIAS